MTENNKETFRQFGKVALLGLIGFIAIIAAAGVWNGVANGAIGSFYGWVAGLNLIAEGFGVYSLYKKFFPKTVKTDEKKPYIPPTFHTDGDDGGSDSE